MINEFLIPQLNTKYICIVNREESELSAVLSSYLQNDKEYSIFFEFPSVSIINPEISNIEFDENYISTIRAQEFNTMLFNAIQRIAGIEKVFYVGLSENQKSFLNFVERDNVLEVNSMDNVYSILPEFSNKNEYLRCSKEDIHFGLIHCLTLNKILIIDENACKVEDLSQEHHEGLVIIEEEDVSATIIAINYGFSVGARIEIIKSPVCSSEEIKSLIYSWKTENNKQSILDLSAFSYEFISHIPFVDYLFATFFTKGYPYSLILNNIIPISHVNTQLQCDFFIFNSFVNELNDRLYSGVVFSPLLFHDKEETKNVIALFEENKVYVKKTIGNHASANELDHTVQEYPYEILHLCSHGGEVSGIRYITKFQDRDGLNHSVEYDEVLSFMPSPIEKEIGVVIKRLWRSFDGAVWKSMEMKEMKLPSYVFSDMVKLLNESDEKKRGDEIKNVYDSCTIKCFDFNHQGMFGLISGNRCYPFIFNNTCHSWSNISESFIGSGATSYIGTLWEIQNTTAQESAEFFYRMAFDYSVAKSLNLTLSLANGTRDSDVYILWGLHFSRLKKGDSIINSKFRVAQNLINAIEYQTKKSPDYKNDTLKSSLRTINWIRNELQTNLRFEFFFMLKGDL